MHTVALKHSPSSVAIPDDRSSLLGFQLLLHTVIIVQFLYCGYYSKQKDKRKGIFIIDMVEFYAQASTFVPPTKSTSFSYSSCSSFSFRPVPLLPQSDSRLQWLLPPLHEPLLPTLADYLEQQLVSSSSVEHR